jgi:hypothetical protein
LKPRQVSKSNRCVIYDFITHIKIDLSQVGRDINNNTLSVDDMLQKSDLLINAFENEIIINVPVASKISISGFLWPVEAWKEFTTGDLLASDDDVTVSPR